MAGFLLRRAIPHRGRRGATILAYLHISTTKGGFDHQTETCDAHASEELCAELRVIDRSRRSE